MNWMLVACILLLVVSGILLVVVLVLLVKLLHRNQDEEYVSETRVLAPAWEAVPLQRELWTIVLQDMQSGCRYEAVLNGPVIFGRAIPGHAYLNDQGIGTSTALSRRQFQVFAYAGRVYLQNLSQVNYTSINHQSAEQPVLLQTGDVIDAAGVMLQVLQLYIRSV